MTTNVNDTTFETTTQTDTTDPASTQTDTTDPALDLLSLNSSHFHGDGDSVFDLSWSSISTTSDDDGSFYGVDRPTPHRDSNASPLNPTTDSVDGTDYDAEFEELFGESVHGETSSEQSDQATRRRTKRKRFDGYEQLGTPPEVKRKHCKRPNWVSLRFRPYRTKQGETDRNSGTSSG
jgi:hypothetical protein